MPLPLLDGAVALPILLLVELLLVALLLLLLLLLALLAGVGGADMPLFCRCSCLRCY